MWSHFEYCFLFFFQSSDGDLDGEVHLGDLHNSDGDLDGEVHLGDLHSSDGEDDEKEQVGAGANLGFAAGSTLVARKNPIKQLTCSKGKQQLVTI